MLRLVAVADLQFEQDGLSSAGAMEKAFMEQWNKFLEESGPEFGCKVSHNEAAILMNRRGHKTGPLKQIVFRGSIGPYKKRKGPKGIDPGTSINV